MINIYLFNYSKKDNSTARPATSAGTKYKCAVKTGSSIISPVVEISVETLPSYNYAYIGNFSRWYFVTNITYERGLWVLSLACDVLASYKDEIGATSAYVTRSSYSWDGDLIDRMYPVKAGYTISNINLDSEQSTPINWTTGTFAVNVINARSTSGYVTYLFTATRFSEFLAALSTDLTDSSVSVWDSITESIKITSYDPLRYIGSVIWFPESMPAGTAITSMKLGNYEVTGISGMIPTKQTSSKAYRITLPKHPQAATRGAFANLAPFSEYTLELGSFGNIKLDTTGLYNKSQLRVGIEADYVTGAGRAIITADDGDLQPDLTKTVILANVVSQYGVPVKISSSNSVSTGSIISTVGGVAGMIGGGLAGSATAALAGFNAAVSGVENMTKGSFDTVGNTGSIYDHQMAKILYARFWTVANDDISNNGRPLCQVKTLSTIPGFIQVQKGTFNSSLATRPEQDAVNAYMEGGFYYE